MATSSRQDWVTKPDQRNRREECKGEICSKFKLYVAI